ncbi:G5 domain-containing protein [Paractinoplanes maris]|uniref:G5 domain-containing protein n=1 Tax=Paractinoplanes maris TaxID=1734446 RepID=UPI00201FC955|nr:G5 domain-containing protein [Actinoplanes maris]
MPRKSWWARLPFGVRMTAGTGALLLAIGGAVVGVAVLAKDGPDAPRIVTAVGQADPKTGMDAVPPEPPAHVPAPLGLDPAATLSRTTDQADRTGPRGPYEPGSIHPPLQTAPQAQVNPRAQVNPQAQAKPPARGQTRPQARGAGTRGPGVRGPVPAQPQPPRKPATVPAKPAAPVVPPKNTPDVTTRTDYEKREVPFQTQFVRDPSLPRGFRKVRVAGVPGEETLRYLVTVTGGQETERKLMDITVTREPQHRVIVFGSRRGFDRTFGGGRGGGEGCRGKKLDLCLLGRQAARPYCPDDQVELLDLEVEVELPEVELPEMDCDPELELPKLPQ